MKRFLIIIVTALGLASVAAPTALLAAWASKPNIQPAGDRCVRIATGGVDHGQENAQKFADELLAGDIESFRKEKGLAALRVERRMHKCDYHLWFFGDEYNCSSVAIVCW